MNFKLPKRARLKKSSAFQKVYKTGKSYANKLMVLYVLPQAEDVRRVGFAAGKKLGKAVVRNRLKRLMREVYRLNQQDIINGVDLVLVARRNMLKCKATELQKSFYDLCRRADILK